MAFVIVSMRNLFAAVMLTGIFSLLCAGLFVIMDAVDVAFTEAAVGAGISTVLMLGALNLTGGKAKSTPTIKLGPLLVVTLTGAMLIYATFDMPHYGTHDAPIHKHQLYQEYVKRSYEKIGVPNVVTSVLASYRGYDTLGEVTVIFTAGTGVLLLLGSAGRRSSNEPEPQPAPRSSSSPPPARKEEEEPEAPPSDEPKAASPPDEPAEEAPEPVQASEPLVEEEPDAETDDEKSQPVVEAKETVAAAAPAEAPTQVAKVETKKTKRGKKKGKKKKKKKGKRTQLAHRHRSQVWGQKEHHS